MGQIISRPWTWFECFFFWWGFHTGCKNGLKFGIWDSKMVFLRFGSGAIFKFFHLLRWPNKSQVWFLKTCVRSTQQNNFWIIFFGILRNSYFSQLGGRFSSNYLYPKLGPPWNSPASKNRIVLVLVEQNFNFLSKGNSISGWQPATEIFFKKINHDSLRLTFFQARKCGVRSRSERHVPNIGKFVFQISFLQS